MRVSDRAVTETREARWLTRGLLMTEVALACTLLIGATMLVRSFVNLTSMIEVLTRRVSRSPICHCRP